VKAIDFLIIGGGIGGAVLANLLGRRGKRVVVLERSRTTAPQARPEILWPATVRILRSLLPESLEARWMVPIRGLVLVFRGRTLLQINPDIFDKAGVQPHSTDNTRALLMQQAPCDYQRGIEVTKVLHDNGRVVGVRARDTANGREQDILADWTIGDDGAHSVIRQGCGLPMTIVRSPVDLLGFRFDWPPSLPANTAHIFLNEDRVRSGLLGMPIMPLPGGKGAALIPVWPEASQNARHLQSAFRGFVAQDPQLSEVAGPRRCPDDMTHFHIGWGRKPCFGTAGALLIGDAAHPVTPAGGQGANSSVADAVAIAEEALERPTQLLEEYRRRRGQAVQRSLSFSRGANRVFSTLRPVRNLGLMALPWAARWLNKRPERFGSLLLAAANAFQDRTTER
jgi:2-polyprenyl-6-methoxyphenol hydroxylase-like FAD-dependent oxidoreductase